MKYIDAEKLKAEIEKHIKEVKYAAERFTPNIGFFDAKLSGIYDVMALIDSLQQEQPDVDLEKAAEEYADKHGFRIPYDGSNNFYDDVDVKASLEGFKAGARWMEEQGESNNWKPTKEQIEYLSKAIYILGEEGDCWTAAVLNELRKNLKKL